MLVPEEPIFIITGLDNETGVGRGVVLAVKLECVILIAKGTAKNVGAGCAGKIWLISAC